MKQLKIPDRRHLITFIKYALSGGIAACAELSLLHLLTSRTSLWYVYASVLSSILGFTISFTLRKLWVFRDTHTRGLSRQLGIYALALALVIVLNTSLMSFLVVQHHLPYVLAQFCAGLVTGLVGFIINNRYTFHKPETKLAAWERKIKHLFTE